MKKYWASEPMENIGKEVIEKFKHYQKFTLQSGKLKENRDSYKNYFVDSEIQDVGQSFKAIHVNEYASLIRSMHTLVTKNRPAWSARAINSDLESQSSAELAEGLLDYYMREKGIEAKVNRATELALMLNEGWVIVDWDVNQGEVIAIDDNEKPILEGDIKVSVASMLDVCRDIYKKDMEFDWFIHRVWENKWDLSAQYPDLYEKIEKITYDEKDFYEYSINPTKYREVDYESDLIPIYKFYHAKTPRLPEGRLTIVADKDTILFDGPLPYKRPYFFPIYTNHLHDMPFGRSNAMDLLPLQKILNANFSAIVTNQSANAVQNFQMPKGSGLKVTQVMDGMNVIEFDPKLGGLAPLDLLKTAPEVFNFNVTVVETMQRMFGISDVSRGQASPELSGTAMALVQQTTIENASNLQLHHTIMLENLGTAIIELLQEYAEEERTAIIAGKSKKPLLKRFKGSDLKGVNRVIIDTANPLTKTVAGRVDMADKLMSTGLIKTPEQYLSVVTTGNLDPLLEYDRNWRFTVRSENEEMMQLKEVPVSILDDDEIHVLEHSCLVSSPEARKNPQLLQVVYSHIQAHLDNDASKDPRLKAFLKQGRIGQGMAPQQAPPQQSMSPVLTQETPLEQEASGVNLPKPAESPLPPQ